MIIKILTCYLLYK